MGVLHVDNSKHLHGPSNYLSRLLIFQSVSLFKQIHDNAHLSFKSRPMDINTAHKSTR